MIKNMSLRLRLTMITTSIIIFVSVILTLVSMNNASSNIISPVNALSSKAVALEKENMKMEVVDDGNRLKDWYGDKAPTISGDSLNMSISYVITSAESNFRYNAYIYMIIAIFTGGGFTYLIIGKMLNPVKELSNQIDNINENQLFHRVVGFQSGDELNKLADSFNTMMDRIDKAFESQKRFSADAAHELKTPLTVLRTNLQVLSMDENPTIDDYAYTVDVFKKQTERMINLVENLFVISAKGEYELKDNISLDKIFTEILSDLQGDIEEKEVKVDINKSGIAIVGNEIMIKHALGNIVQNAVKYNKNGGSISVSIEERDHIIIRVKDTGIGIPEEKAPNIFQAFYRVDSSRSRKIGGAGLGLSISYNVIKNHGGNIIFKNNKDGGSIFEIELPKICF